jgi:RNA polymerase sigma-70 factor (ECF subfamily)
LPVDTSYSERELIERVSRGEESSFAMLYDRYSKRVYSIALLYLKSPQAAEDIVQEVFLKIWLHRENLSQVREFKPYLIVTSRNVTISNLRNKFFHEYLNVEDQQEESILLPERNLLFKESVDLLHRAVELLPPQQQTAYKLSREGMSYEEIARKMGISRLTVRNHISKALDYLRKFLTDHSLHPVLVIIALYSRY